MGLDLEGCFNDWEVGELQRFLVLLHRQGNQLISLKHGAGDFGNNGVFFFLKTFYKNMLVREEQVFSCNAIWIPKASRKVCFFTWLATRGAILTTENLRKRKVVCTSLTMRL